MNKEEIYDLYMRSIKLWGVESQVRMAFEEMGELTQAICKMQRGCTLQRYRNLCEEIADLEIVMGQIREIFNVDEDLVNKYKEEKLERYKKKLEKYE